MWELSGLGVCVLDFCHCDKIPEVNNLKRGKVYLVHSFSGFRSWPVALGLWQHRASWWADMAEEACLPHGI